MALSDKVEDKMKEAEGILRDAVYWAAKNEKPFIINAISKIILEIDTLIKIDKFQDKLEDSIKNKNNNDPGFFGGLF